MKPKTSSVRFFLVCHFGISNALSVKMINDGEVLLNGHIPSPIQAIFLEDTLEVGGRIIKEPMVFQYYAYHKPKGVECTMNTEIPFNLVDSTQLPSGFFPLGRLDKDSEGLVVLTITAKSITRLLMGMLV